MKKKQVKPVIVNGLDFTNHPSLLSKYRAELAKGKKCCGGKNSITRKYATQLSRYK
jgi:hypothetical protein